MKERMRGPEGLKPTSNFINIEYPEKTALGAALRASHGNALVLVHPMFVDELDALRSRLSGAQSLEDQKDALWRQNHFDRYAHEIVRLAHAAHDRNLPVICLFESQEKLWTKGKKRVIQAASLSMGLESMQTYGYVGGGTLFYRITVAGDPAPLSGIDDWHYYYQRSRIFARSLKAHGLRYAVLAGAYFYGIGGGDSYTIENARPRSAIALMVRRERKFHPDSANLPHPLTVLKTSGCVPAVAQYFAEAGIRTRFARPATYPNLMPTTSELVIDRQNNRAVAQTARPSRGTAL